MKTHFHSVFITSSNPLSLLNSGNTPASAPNSQLAAALAQLASGGIGGSALPANLSNLLGQTGGNSSSEKQPENSNNTNNNDDEDEEISPVEWKSK